MIIVAVTTFAGLILFAFSQPRHFLTLTSRSNCPALSWKLVLGVRVIGYLILALSIRYSIHLWGVGLGLSYFFGLFALVSMALSIGLSALKQH